MKRITLILAFAMVASITSAAQDKPKTNGAEPAKTEKTEAKAESLPTVDDIIGKYVTATGGKEAMEKITSRAMKGSFDLEAFGVSGAPLELFTKAPNKRSMKIDVCAGLVNRVFDGSTAWFSDPMNGLRELQGIELWQMKRESDFYQVANLKKIYTKVEVKGKEKVGSSEAYLIEGVPAEGSPEKYYFDVNTGLLVRFDAEIESPQGKAIAETYLEDYKAVDGVKIPHTLKIVNPGMTMVFKIAEVKSNVEIEDAKFGKPSN